MPIIRRSSKKLPSARLAELERLAERIDREEMDSIRAKGRAIRARHSALRDAVSFLRAERERRGLSLNDIGERSGIGKSNLSRLENDPNPNPTMETLMRYAEALGVELRIMIAPRNSAA